MGIPRWAVCLALLTCACGGGAGGDDAPPDASEPAPDASPPCDLDCSGLDGPCVQGVCVSGGCQAVVVADDTDCEDGLACTDGDRCVLGACVGAPVECDAADECHLARCDESSGGCVSIAAHDFHTCEDGDLCTTGTYCLGGSCFGGAGVDCSGMNDACHVGRCDDASGDCVADALPDTTPCDDGNLCTGGDQCTGGACDGDPSQAAGLSCNDTLYCTVDDACAGGACVGDARVCAGEDACHVGACDDTLDQCPVTTSPDTTPCDDDNDCTAQTSCTTGVCGDGNAVNQGLGCDDHDACTLTTTCSAGVCGGGTSIVACAAGDGCCPSGCTGANDSDCLYWASGVLSNVAPATLVGWTACYEGDYGDSPALSTILAQCDQANLLMACRPTGTTNFSLAAMAPRADVLFDCGTQVNCTKQSNGVGWYYAGSFSWGFAPGGQAVDRESCDIATTGGDQRLCWHTTSGSIQLGWRCGNNTFLSDASWQRVIYEAP